MGSILSPNNVIAKDVKRCTYCCYVRCGTLIVWVGGMPWPQTGATQYHVQLGLPDKARASKWMVSFNNWDLKPLDLLIGRALGCYNRPLRYQSFVHSYDNIYKNSRHLSLKSADMSMFLIYCFLLSNKTLTDS